MTSGPARLVWNEEFDGPAGTRPDATKWSYELGDGSDRSAPGWGNRELEYYTDLPENASTDGHGSLVITAAKPLSEYTCYYGPCEYTSARLLTKNHYDLKYGRVEARIKVPAGAGTWPAFWMLGTDIDQTGWPGSGEIDIVECVGRTPERVYGTIHGPGYSGTGGFGGTIDLPQPVSNDFHVFAIDWQPGLIIWTVDGTEYHRATPDSVAPNAWVYDHDFFLILNLAVGGDFPGQPDSSTKFPAHMLIDYIRIYQQ